MLDFEYLEKKIKHSTWWHTASKTIDSHHSNDSGVMLSHHLLAVYKNVETVFVRKDTAFCTKLFDVLNRLNLDTQTVENELKIVALLHDIGKPQENKNLVIPHPLTGKPAHKRHGLVALMATMEILGEDFSVDTDSQKRIYRTVELHDMSYGLFREFIETGSVPESQKWSYINDKMHQSKGGGLIYLLIFKLADIHGHNNVSDVIWFYEIVNKNYFAPLGIIIPIPTEADIREIYS